MSEWSEAKCAGYALAALVAGDRALEAARDAVPPAAEQQARALLANDPGASQDGGARRQRVERLLRAVRPELPVLQGGEHPSGVPRRLLALLATRLPRAQARTLLASAPRPRAGFSAADDLWPRLHRIARRSIGAGGSSP